MQHIDTILGILFGVLGAYLVYRSIDWNNLIESDGFRSFFKAYCNTSWFLLPIAIGFFLFAIQQRDTLQQRYDDLYRHKENILNELLSQGKNTAKCDTTLYYSLDEVSPEAMFVDTLIVDNPSVLIHCNGYWNRLKGTLRGKKGDAVIKCDIYVDGKKLRMKSVCADYY